MYLYYIYGSVVSSDLLFPQLVVADESAQADIEIYGGEMPEWMLREENKKYDFGENFSWLSNSVCMFYVEEGKRIVYYLKPGQNEMYLKSFILGFGLSMLFLQRGDMAIHCSALHNGSSAVLIAGESGSGKSTITNFLLRDNWKLMADDIVVVKNEKEKGILVYPAFPYQKLCRNVALERGYKLDELIYINEKKDKYLVPYEGDFDLKPMPLDKVIMLGVCNIQEVLVEEIKGIARWKLCLDNLFLRKLLKERRYEPKIGQKCLDIAAKAEMLFIGRPITGNTTEQIEAHVHNFIANN